MFFVWGGVCEMDVEMKKGRVVGRIKGMGVNGNIKVEERGLYVQEEREGWDGLNDGESGKELWGRRMMRCGGCGGDFGRLVYGGLKRL